SLSQAYDKLVNQIENYQHTTINEYAATNPAEFFAVTSEYFFTAPKILKELCPDVYRQLVLFYKQDLLN
ncbi:MAG: zinc-dependent peptidase, partial [Thiotrichaceae bacterium]|nr:zinc-dependent peptidase [Thiotrichaceae bacterium]